ncbi:uncharacterized protein [Ranitomeya imitator]|uniref:uncharacterized protein n=1 Tax=Ranitomeya imitator TaxID=111125 RepID=UPI0037E8DD0C
MAAQYKKQSKEALTSLCEQRGIETADRSRELLIRALVEQDMEQSAGTSGQCENSSQRARAMPALALEMPEGSVSNASAKEPMDFTLQMALQELGISDPNLHMQLILQYREAAAAERREDRAFKLQMTQIERGISPQITPFRDINPRRPHLENFPVLEKDTDLDTFLWEFEKTCRQYHLAREQWAQYLTSGLRVKALEVFAGLPPELDGNYEAIKKALIRKYNLTPEVYRRKFRNLQRGSTDSYADVVSTLRTTFHQWIRGLSVTSFEDFMDLTVKDKFLHMCPTDVRQFVCDREPQSADQAAKIADCYVANRMPEVWKPSGCNWKGGKPKGDPSPSAGRSPVLSKPTSYGNPGNRIIHHNERRCFSYNKVGHVSAVCPHREKRPTTTTKPSVSPPSVLFVAGSDARANENCQSVTVGNKVTIGLRDTEAEVTLMRPAMITPADIISGKTRSITGIEGVSPVMPMARVYLNWGAGKGLREVGVSEAIPTNVLLGTDLGRMVSHYVPSLHVNATEKVEASDPPEILCEEGKCPNAQDCTYVAAVTQSQAAAQTQAQRLEDESQIELPEQEAHTVAPEPPQMAGPTRSLITDTEDSASDQGLVVTLGQGLQTDSQSFQEALWTDVSLEELRCLAERPPAASDKERVYWDQGRLYKETLPTGTTESWDYERRLIVPYPFREMLTDQGTQFMSVLMESLCEKIQVQHVVASAYHPQTNGLCKCFNGTLKQMLKMLVETEGRDWERLPEEGEPELLLDVGGETQYMEFLESAEFNPELSHIQRSELMGALSEFTEVFTGEPRRMHLAAHHVDTGTNPPVWQSSYRVSAEVKAHIREQVEEMLNLTVIQNPRVPGSRLWFLSQ